MDTLNDFYNDKISELITEYEAVSGHCFAKRWPRLEKEYSDACDSGDTSKLILVRDWIYRTVEDAKFLRK